MSLPNIFQIIFMYLDTSEMQCIIYRPYLYNLKTRGKKKLRVATELSINIKTKDTFSKYDYFPGLILRPKNA